MAERASLIVDRYEAPIRESWLGFGPRANPEAEAAFDALLEYLTGVEDELRQALNTRKLLREIHDAVVPKKKRRKPRIPKRADGKPNAKTAEWDKARRASGLRDV